MTRIVVPPEKLQDISNQFAQASEQSRNMISNLSRHISSLQSQWSGITQERFFQNFQVAHRQMANFSTSVSSIGTELNTIATRFAQADQSQGAGVQANGGQSPSGKDVKTTLSDLYDQGSKSWDKISGIHGNVGLFGTAMYSALATSMVLSKSVHFKVDPRNRTRAKVHNAPWVKGKGNSFLSNMARKLDKQFRNPGLVMKGLKGFDKLAGKLKVGDIGLGFSKANSFGQWTRNVIAGVTKGQYGMKTSQIPKMISKKLFPINVGLNVWDEGVKTVSKFKEGTLTKTDLAVSASNVVIKSASAGAGAIVGGTLLGAVLGPPGAAIGSYVGGSVGAWAGNYIAGVAEKGIRWFTSRFK
ncbi:WXG100 family type VII secretion target [Paenibacillus xylanexedens]|uniref:WXG100 family type VII secretion target n=1 Tax=Paenibacillus xylanexedens TaxID=528191 RepID=UPI0011A40721|nr:WXG100 family type VII secretion target [Paenibacillus xylanexedens]